MLNYQRVRTVTNSLDEQLDVTYDSYYDILAMRLGSEDFLNLGNKEIGCGHNCPPRKVNGVMLCVWGIPYELQVRTVFAKDSVCSL